jgi:hypothetical protein
MLKLFQKIGPLRVLHALFLLVLILSAPFAMGESAHSGLRMWPTLIAPALVPIFVFVLPLDMTMAAISRSGVEGEEHQRLTTVIRFDMILYALLLGAWMPFFLSLLQL